MRHPSPLHRLSVLALLALAALALAGGLAAQAGISKVNGSIRLDAGQQAGDLSTVNGGIRLAEQAVAGRIETVNGGIRMERGARAAAIDAVNGGIRLAEDCQVEGDLQGVNGAITLLAGSRVGGELGNVNGTISLERAQVGGGLTTTNGSVLVGAGSRIQGDLLVKRPRGTLNENRPPRVVIGPDAEVAGSLRFERPVRLYVHARARTGPIEGATPERCWFLKVGEISHVVIDGNYAHVHFRGQRALVQRSLALLEERLDPAMFFRASRGVLVNLRHVRDVEPGVGDGYTLHLEGGAQVEVSRRQAREFRERLAL